MNQLRDSKTKFNLMKAFAGESQARNRYTFGASQAKSEKLVLIEQAFYILQIKKELMQKYFITILKNYLEELYI